MHDIYVGKYIYIYANIHIIAPFCVVKSCASEVPGILLGMAALWDTLHPNAWQVIQELLDAGPSVGVGCAEVVRMLSMDSFLLFFVRIINFKHGFVNPQAV